MRRKDDPATPPGDLRANEESPSSLCVIRAGSWRTCGLFCMFFDLKSFTVILFWKMGVVADETFFLLIET